MKSNMIRFVDLKEGYWYLCASGSYLVKRSGTKCTYLDFIPKAGSYLKVSHFYPHVSAHDTFGSKSFHRTLMLSKKINLPIGFFNTMSPMGYEL